MGEDFVLVTPAVRSNRKLRTRQSLSDADTLPLIGTLRVSAVWGLPALLAESGIDLAEVLATAGLPAHLFADRDDVFTYPELERLFLVCERRLQCDHVGLLIGERSNVAEMGLAGEAALCGHTAGAGLRAFIDHFNLHDTAATCTLFEDGPHCRFVYSILEHGMDDTRNFQFGALAITTNILRDLCGPEFVPVSVGFASRAPTSLRAFNRLFRAPLLFDQEESSITFHARWLLHPLPEVDTVYRESVAARLRAQHDAMLADFPAVVRRIVRKQLLRGSFTMDDVARILSMHRRTLDRHLQCHGVQYGEIVEQVREDVACQLLHDTLVPIRQIAETVRFSSAANFATAFRRRTGLTPTSYRRAATQSYAARRRAARADG